ncbi:MAG: response regulator [Desulfobulbaceae bacterium]|nr:response regulator [Desulfobulbaceae bacterium]
MANIYAGGVAHDLNNILSGVVGYPELLLAELPKDSALRHPLEATKEAGERATAVVADLLTVARGIANTKKVMGNLSGTGLGLSIVWNTMQDHQGAVIVSRTESATTFELYFPATREITAANKPIGHHTEEQGNGEKILMVDDEPQLRDLAKSMLTLLGYNVTCQDSGENALAYLQSQQVDLVLLDMLMEPGINGRETYERMLEIHPGQKAIIASGLSESDDVKAAQTMGAGGFIQKPYSIKQLGKSVKKVLRN